MLLCEVKFLPLKAFESMNKRVYSHMFCEYPQVAHFLKRVKYAGKEGEPALHSLLIDPLQSAVFSK